jgi:ribosomal protein S18 acetylase RimI-like enzyme
MSEVIYKTDFENIDWVEMKTTLQEDAFDNGRSPEQLQKSFENSFATCVAYVNNRIIGTARILSDGVCNAYLVDVWTLSAFRRQGIASTMIQIVTGGLEGQHVYLCTDIPEFYAKLGFVEQPTGMSKIIGTWLVNRPHQP